MYADLSSLRLATYTYVHMREQDTRPGFHGVKIKCYYVLQNVAASLPFGNNTVILAHSVAPTSTSCVTSFRWPLTYIRAPLRSTSVGGSVSPNLSTRSHCQHWCCGSYNWCGRGCTTVSRTLFWNRRIVNRCTLGTCSRCITRPSSGPERLWGRPIRDRQGQR